MSPVIATILMVAITVVLSGVIFVWANSLADTDTKGVPRVAFGLDGVDTADQMGTSPSGSRALRPRSQRRRSRCSSPMRVQTARCSTPRR